MGPFTMASPPPKGPPTKHRIDELLAYVSNQHILQILTLNNCSTLLDVQETIERRIFLSYGNKTNRASNPVQNQTLYTKN